MAQFSLDAIYRLVYISKFTFRLGVVRLAWPKRGPEHDGCCERRGRFWQWSQGETDLVSDIVVRAYHHARGLAACGKTEGSWHHQWVSSLGEDKGIRNRMTRRKAFTQRRWGIANHRGENGISRRFVVQGKAGCRRSCGDCNCLCAFLHYPCTQGHRMRLGIRLFPAPLFYSRTRK